MDESLPLPAPVRQTLGGLALALGAGVPAGARRLIWDEFFASRGRGIDWATHLPWAVPGTVLCASAADDTGETAAALLIRRVPDAATAMVGCVCVDPRHRGHGLSGRLIDLAAPVLHGLGLAQMLLWTGKPAIYERCGFVVSARERQLTLRCPAELPDAPVTLSPWGLAGLPPYALAGWAANAAEARLVFVDTPRGAALLDHAGAPEAVLRAMAAARPGDWSATLGEDQPLARHALAAGACIEATAGPATMYRPLGADTTVPAYVAPAFRI